MHRLAAIAVIAAAALALLLLAAGARPPRAQAAPDLTFVVTSPADAADVNPGDGVCLTAGLVCTMRAAIQEANSSAGADTILFAPTAAGSTVTLASNLDPIIEKVTIDASSCTPLPEACGTAGFGISGNGLYGGLVLDEAQKSGAGQGSTIRGLEISRVFGNWSGATPSGPNGATRSVSAAACSGSGICVLSNSNHVIGGDAGSGNAPAGQGNIIRANNTYGIRLYNSAGGDRIVGNRIGTSADGLNPAGNGSAGVEVTGNTFSGTITIGDFGGSGVQGFRNLISANGTTNELGGIRSINTNASVIAMNNWIGLNVNGEPYVAVGFDFFPLANRGDAIEGTSYNAISIIGNRIGGGFKLGQGSVGLTRDGVHLTGSTGNSTILGNCVGFKPDCVGPSPFQRDAINVSFQGGTTVIGNGFADGRNFIGNAAEERFGIYSFKAPVQVTFNHIGAAADLSAASIGGSCVYIGSSDRNSIVQNVIANCGGVQATAAVASLFIDQATNSSIFLNDITSPGGADAVVVQGSQAAGNEIYGGSFTMVGTSGRPNAIPIDLRLDVVNQEGSTPNDATDSDGGANGLHNYPAMAVTSGVSGCAAGKAGPGDTIDVYQVIGSTYAHAFSRTTADGAGNFTLCGFADGSLVVATATARAGSPDPAGSTSEMSPVPQSIGSGGPSSGPIFGNNNCGPGIDIADAIQALLYLAGLGVDNPGSCPDVGSLVIINGSQMIWGDVDCNGVIDVSDAIRLLLWLAGLPVTTPPGCPPLGSAITLS